MATITKSKSRPAAGESPARLAGAIVNIPIDNIAPHPSNPRNDWNEPALQDLAESIKQHSVLSPVVVRRKQGGEKPFELIFGERRLRASKLAGEATVPARVLSCSDPTALLMLGEENLMRRDLNKIELARYFRTLNAPIDRGGAGMTHKQIAQRFGRQEDSWVTNLVRLLELPEDLQARVASGKLHYTCARALLPYKDQPEVLDAIRADMQANPFDWVKRDDVERNAAWIAKQTTAPASADVASSDDDPRASSRPTLRTASSPPASPAATQLAPVSRIDQAPAIAGPALPGKCSPSEADPAAFRRADALELLEGIQHDQPALELVRDVCKDLIHVIRRGVNPAD